MTPKQSEFIKCNQADFYLGKPLPVCNHPRVVYVETDRVSRLSEEPSKQTRCSCPDCNEEWVIEETALQRTMRRSRQSHQRDLEKALMFGAGQWRL